MRPWLADTLLRRLLVLGLLFASCGAAWAAADNNCSYAKQDANAEGTGMGGTGTMAQGTGIGGTGIQLGVYINEMQLAGNVLASQGDVVAESNGSSRTLTKGDPVCAGDTITTAPSASLQLKMVDGGMLTIRPQTQLRIEKFVYRGTRKDGSLLVLLRGACHVITGNIGKLYPDNDLLKTPDATIGVSEADHEASVILPGNDGGYPPGTYDKVNHGTTFISTGKGEISVRPDQVGFAENAEALPTLLMETPGFYHADDSMKQEAPPPKERNKE